MTPEVGIHEGVPMAEYFAWDACSNSRLKPIAKSPAHVAWALTHPEEASTDAQSFGRAVHMALLEPDLYASTYVELGACEATKRSGDPCSNQATKLLEDGRQVCGVHANTKGAGPEDTSRQLITSSDVEGVQAILASVEAKRKASGLFRRGHGQAEVCLVWEDEATGVLCKARVDWLDQELGGGTIVDVKTTGGDAHPLAFEREIVRFDYHVQAAHYVSGAATLGIPIAHYCILPCEKQPPFEVSVLRLTEGAIDGGDEIRRLRLQVYAMCLETGKWPGYTDGVMDVALPNYAWHKIDDEKDHLMRFLDE